MFSGSRVTDAVDFFKRRGELRGAVKTVRARTPERFRWRRAVGTLTESAAPLRGLERMRIEEPIREVVLDLADPELQRAVVLDARRAGLDLDRGEILPIRTVSDVRRFAFLTGTDLALIEKFVALPLDFQQRVDTAAIAVVGNAYAEAHRRRAQRVWANVRPATPGAQEPPTVVRAAPESNVAKALKQRAQREARLGERWSAFSRAICAG